MYFGAIFIIKRSAGERKQTKRNAQSKALAPNRERVRRTLSGKDSQ